MIVLVDGDRHGDGYITPMQIGSYFYQPEGFLSSQTPHYMNFQGLIGPINNNKVKHLYNLQQ